jgi:thermolysin
MARARALAELEERHEIERIRLDGDSVPELVRGILSSPVNDGDFAGAAEWFFEANRILFGLASPADRLRVESVTTDELAMTHVRLRHYHDGVRVMYGDMRAHFGADRVLRVVNGEVTPDLALSTTPVVPAAAARQSVAAELLVDPGTTTAELVIYPSEGVAHLAWRVGARVQDPPGRWEFFVDATTGATIAKANRIQYAGAAAGSSGSTAGSTIGSGIGVMGDTKTHIDSYFDDQVYWLDDHTRQANHNPHGHNGSMPDTAFIQSYFYSDGLPGLLIGDDDNIWDDPSQAPGVDAQVYTGYVYDFLNHNVLRNGFDDQGSSMISTVEDASCQNNAYWDGNQVSYCRVSSEFNSMVGGLDVVAHEWGHAVTEHTSNLVYAKEPGALNESFSDMIGIRLRFAHGDPGWRIGQYYNGTGFRDVSNPRIFGDPDCRGGVGWVDVEDCNPSRGNDWCGVHTNCGVGNRMFYLLSEGGEGQGRTVTGIGIDAAFKIMYRANRFYWTETSDLEDGKEGSVSAAMDLDPTGEWAEEVELAWAAVCVGVSANLAPAAVPGGPYLGVSGALIEFDGTASRDPDGWITSYIWDFGDGAIAFGGMTYHVYQTEGTYQVTLLVIDNANVQSMATTTAEISPPSAVALSSFELVSSPDAVIVVWETSFEEDHLGFHVHRREEKAESFVRLTGRLITDQERRGGGYEYVDRTVAGGASYDYRLEAVDRRGESQLFLLGTVAIPGASPSAGRLVLHPNRPNPFNPRTTIAFELPAADRVVIRIYDSNGRLVRLLCDERLAPGTQAVDWDGRDNGGRLLDSGIYLCRLNVGTRSLARKIVMVH